MSSSFPSNASESGAANGDSRAKGKLKVYLGYAAGVGKTYQMLEEAHVLVGTGVDMVIGYFEPHARPDTTALLGGLELIPRRTIEYRGSKFSEMDWEAILLRRPEVALVDEFPHTNVPGSERTKRWEDVLYLLDHGIDVWTTMNVQHLESLNDGVYQMTGVRIRETVPDWVVQQASEVVMVDLAPRALLNRLDRGVIYPGDKAESAKLNFFKEGTLVGLRELALRETAFELESRHNLSGSGSENYSENQSENQDGAGEPNPRKQKATPCAPGKGEKILVLLTTDPSTAALIRRGKRVADYLKGGCLAVALCPRGEVSSLPTPERKALEKHLDFARNLRVPTQILPTGETAGQLVSFAHQNGVTQIYLARPKAQSWTSPFRRDLIQQIVQLAGDIEITIVAERASRS